MEVILIIFLAVVAIFFYQVAKSLHDRVERLEKKEVDRKREEINQSVETNRDAAYATLGTPKKGGRKKGTKVCHCGKVCNNERGLRIHQARSH